MRKRATWLLAVATVLAAGALLWWASPSREARPVASEERAPSSAPPTPPTLAEAPRDEKAPLRAAEPAPEPPTSETGDYVVAVVVRDVASDAPVRGVPIRGWWSGIVGGSFAQHDASGTTDADGRAALRVTESPAGPLGRFAVGADWHVVGWHREGAPDDRRIDAAKGAVTRIVVRVRRAFRLRGTVEDPQGRPVPEVDVSFGVPTRTPEGVEIANVMSQTRADGEFDLGPFAEDPAEGYEDVRSSFHDPYLKVTFRKGGYATYRLDPRSVPSADRARVRVRLSPGAVLAGVLVDDRGRPLPDAVVAVEYGADWNLRRGARTDDDGRFRIDRLASGRASLVARAFAHDAKAKREVSIDGDDLDVRLVAEPIRQSRPPRTTRVLGLELADVDDELRAAYDVPDRVKVLILDPGPDSAILGIGRLEKGFGLWMVGEEAPTSVRDAVERLLSEKRTQNDSAPGMKRVVYSFWNERASGNNTQYIRFGPGMREELQAVLDRVPR